MTEESEPTNQSRLIIRPSTGLISHPDGGSSAMSEMVNRSLVHIQTSKSLALPARRAGEEQEFEIAPGVKIVMCWIPPGEFLMGSPEDEFGRVIDETLHSVTITQGFWLAKTQTTQAQWEAVVGSNPSFFKGNHHPVEQVSWNHISGPGGFLETVNQYAGAQGIFSLPTEAQWEYACRAGTTTPLHNGKKLTSYTKACPNLDELAWYYWNSGGETHPVEQKKPNAWRLHDMHGNVLEWCSDWYGIFARNPPVDHEGPKLGACRVCRGGSWGFHGGNCRVSYRLKNEPNTTSSRIGFRIARSSVS